MTKEYITFKVDKELKKDFERFFKSKYDNLDDIYEFEIGKLLKFILAVNGNNKYQDDPDVGKIVDMVDKNFTGAHAHKVFKNDLLVPMEEKIGKLEERIGKLNPSKKALSMDMYVEGFLSTFKDNLKVTKKDIEKYTMVTEDILDHRSIRNRIRYLEASDIIKESSEPGAYILIENYLS